jgi:hypothetical protein
MGIGKLAFLQFVDEAVGGGAGHERVIRGDYFVCRRLGLGFVKPSAWHFHAFEDFFPILQGQSFVDGSTDDSEEHAAGWRDLVSVISKDPIGVTDDPDSRRFSPGITIFKEASLCDEDASDLEALVMGFIEYNLGLLREFVILESPRSQTISMCPAIQYTSQFVFEHRELSPTLVRDRTLVVDQGRQLFTIHLFDSPATGEVIGPEFDAFIGSLHVA